ncbi:MAG: helix-turn-helix transcriptional regulator [Methylorubrum rhodinum]|uniref:helix-turn-helix domain-containing protein n=1 Tax=Methylorubrum rhodinum TaxID=29428 RepID=UPI003BAEC96B
MAKHQRLKSARIRAGYKTAREAASQLNIPYGTYSGHESGSRGIKDEELLKYAEFFGVSPAWLSYGHENQTLKSRKFSVISGVAGTAEDGEVRFLKDEEILFLESGLQVASYDDDNNIVLDFARIPRLYFMAPGLEAFPSAKAIRIEGRMLHPILESRSIAYFHGEMFEDTDGYKYDICLCWIETGRAIIGKPSLSFVQERSIVAVSPLVACISGAGLLIWLESFVAAFNQDGRATVSKMKDSAKSS